MEPPKTQVTDVTAGGPSRDGHRIAIVFAVKSGNPALVEMPVEVASKLLDILPIEIGKAHDFRTAADPTYRRLESTETTKTRRVDAYEIGVDLVKRVTVLRARHPGGLITDLPIGEAQLSSVIDGLQRMLDKIKSGERPPPTH